MSEINHPAHYTHGIEAIDFIESHQLNFSLGNAIKYLEREIARLKAQARKDAKG